MKVTFEGLQRLGLWLFVPGLIGAAPPAYAGFDFASVIEQARVLSRETYEDRKLPLTGDFASLEYDQHRDIRFDTDRNALAESASAFGMDLLPPGWLFDRPVAINRLSSEGVDRLVYSNDWFDFGPQAVKPENPDDLTFSGFRLRSPINRPDVMDEVAVFQGASYFRAVARDQLYGLSARALALDTATERGEEFPRFVEFWVEEPGKEAANVIVHALLDSPSVTGALRFDIIPGADTRMDVRAVLFPRRDLSDVGIAPLTSMFLFNNLNRERFDDYRDAVHDSSGLQMINGAGKRMWRSLANPATLQVSAFIDENPVGFGLVQRQRNFQDYEDAEAHYEKRPSAWVEPLGDWGKGAVQLVEIPTDLEINDNIVAFWKPQQTLLEGEEYRFEYRLLWTDHPPDEVPLMRVKDVRIGKRMKRDDVLEVIVDFEARNGDLDGEAVPEIDVSDGKMSDLAGRVLSGQGRYRVHFNFRPDDVTTSEWQLTLMRGQKPVSETWTYRWTP